MKVMVGIAVALFAVFVGGFIVLVIIAFDNQYPNDPPQRVYTYEDDADRYDYPDADRYDYPKAQSSEEARLDDLKARVILLENGLRISTADLESRMSSLRAQVMTDVFFGAEDMEYMVARISELETSTRTLQQGICALWFDLNPDLEMIDLDPDEESCWNLETP